MVDYNSQGVSAARNLCNWEALRVEKKKKTLTSKEPLCYPDGRLIYPPLKKAHTDFVPTWKMPLKIPSPHSLNNTGRAPDEIKKYKEENDIYHCIMTLQSMPDHEKWKILKKHGFPDNRRLPFSSDKFNFLISSVSGRSKSICTCTPHQLKNGPCNCATKRKVSKLPKTSKDVSQTSSLISVTIPQPVIMPYPDPIFKSCLDKPLSSNQIVICPLSGEQQWPKKEQQSQPEQQYGQQEQSQQPGHQTLSYPQQYQQAYKKYVDAYQKYHQIQQEQQEQQKKQSSPQAFQLFPSIQKDGKIKESGKIGFLNTALTTSTSSTDPTNQETSQQGAYVAGVYRDKNKNAQPYLIQFDQMPKSYDQSKGPFFLTLQDTKGEEEPQFFKSKPKKSVGLTEESSGVVLRPNNQQSTYFNQNLPPYYISPNSGYNPTVITQQNSIPQRYLIQLDPSEINNSKMSINARNPNEPPTFHQPKILFQYQQPASPVQPQHLFYVDIPMSSNINHQETIKPLSSNHPIVSKKAITPNEPAKISQSWSYSEEDNENQNNISLKNKKKLSSKYKNQFFWGF